MTRSETARVDKASVPMNGHGSSIMIRRVRAEADELGVRKADIHRSLSIVNLTAHIARDRRQFHNRAVDGGLSACPCGSVAC
jgi:hypothetical protein